MFLLLPLLLSLVSCGGGRGQASVTTPASEESTVRKVYPDEVVKLTVKSRPTKLSYTEGETFSPSGLEMTATLGDGSTEDVYIGDCEIYPSGELMPTDQSVKVVYFEGSVEFPITVTPNPCVSLQMESKPVVESYLPGQKLSLDGLHLTGTLQDGTKKDSISSYSLLLDGKDYDVRKALPEEIGSHTLTFSYHSATVDFPIEIFQGSIVEAENILDTTAMTIDSKNFLEKMNPDYSFRKVSNPMSEPASGKAYIGYIREGDILRFHIYSDTATTARLFLRAASASYLGKDGQGQPLEMNSILVSNVCRMDFNGEAFPLTDQVMPGAVSRYRSENRGDSLLWVKWQDADLGTVSLVKGDNTLTIDTTRARQFKEFNLDRLEIRSLEKGE